MIKFNKKNFRSLIKNYNFPKLIEFFKWKFIDLYRVKKYGRKLHLYGIIGIVGLYGGGKTIALSHYLTTMKEKHGDDVYIATNYYYNGQDFPITHWKDLLKEYDKPVIFGYDELQNEFNSRDYKDFPVELMTLLTQNRKGNGKQIIYTTQDYTTVDKNFRRLTKTIWACKTRFSRYTSVREYDREDFEMLDALTDVNKRMKIRNRRFSFIQTDDLRNSYDSYQMLETAKNKQYLNREEKARLTVNL